MSKPASRPAADARKRPGLLLPSIVLQKLASESWPILRAHMDPDSCIAAARLGVDFLRQWGIHAEPIVCKVAALNAIMVTSAVEDPGEVLGLPEGAYIVETDTKENGEGFAGHVVLVGKASGRSFFLDLTAPQFTREEHGIVVARPVFFRCRPERPDWELSFELPRGGLLVYRAHTNAAWRRAPAWTLPTSVHKRVHERALADLNHWIRGEPVRLFKECGCGRHFTLDHWRLLPLVGLHKDEVESLVMRNCRCGSTLCVPVLPYLDDGSAELETRRRTT
jgi:hypothetical protein